MPDGRSRCWPRRWGMLTFNMFGASCASTISIWPPASPGARAMTLSSRRKLPMSWVFILTRRPRRLFSVSMKNLRSRRWNGHRGIRELPNGRALTGQSHDYKRHGTTTLFAALDVASGRIIAEHSKRRRRIEFLGFMNRLVAAFPDRQLHVILDNLNTHKKNERWLKRHSKVHFHFTPTGSSWLNQVEIWFSVLQGQSLTGASFTTVEDLQEHIDAFIATYKRLPRRSPGLRKGSPAPVQKSPYHPAVIPGTRSL